MSRVEHKPTRSTRPATVILVLIICGFAGQEVLYWTLDPLRRLRIDFPPILSYAHLIAPTVAAAAWLPFRRKRPNTSAIAAYFLCQLLLMGFARYADGYVHRIPVRRYLTFEEEDALQRRVAFPFFGQSSSGAGHEVFVENKVERVERLTAELNGLGVIRQPGDPLWPEYGPTP